MTNVIPFVARAATQTLTAPVAVADPVVTACTTDSVVADLVSNVAEIKELSERVLPLPYDAREVERKLQSLLDAISNHLAGDPSTLRSDAGRRSSLVRGRRCR